MHKTQNNILVGITALIAGTWLMLELRENRQEVAVEIINTRMESLKINSEKIQQETPIRQEKAKQAAAQKREEVDRKKAEEKLAIEKAKKENSHECQFWKLQKKQGNSPKADEKITEHCKL